MAGSLKRRHEESAVAPLSDYHLRKEDHQATDEGSDHFDESYLADEDRVNSPNNVLDAHRMFSPPVRESKRTLSFKQQERTYDADDDAEKRVTIWNWREQRNLSGNSAPFKKNLQEYIRKHPDWEEYVGQDKDAQTGKKLPAKKMLPPAPRDPSHPYYHMPRQGANSAPAAGTPSTNPAPGSPVPQQTSYGTRSSQSRTREVIATVSPSKTWTRAPADIHPDLAFPMTIILESPAAVAMRRSLEMAQRHKEMVQQCDEEEEDQEGGEEALRIAKDAELAAWEAATAAVAAEKAKKETAQQKLVQEQLESRQNAHEEQQDVVVSGAMARIQAFKKRRLMAVVA